MQIHSAGLDEDGPCDEINEEIRLGTRGQLELFFENPGGFLQGGRIVDIEIGKHLALGSPTGNGQKKKSSQNDGYGHEAHLHEDVELEDHDRCPDSCELIDTFQIIVV